MTEPQTVCLLSTLNMLVEDIKTDLQLLEKEVDAAANRVRRDLLSVRKNINNLKSDLGDISKSRRNILPAQFKLKRNPNKYVYYNTINNIGLGWLPYQYCIPWTYLPCPVISQKNKNNSKITKKDNCPIKITKFKRETSKVSNVYKKRLKLVFNSSLNFVTHTVNVDVTRFNLLSPAFKKSLDSSNLKLNVPNSYVTKSNINVNVNGIHCNTNFINYNVHSKNQSRQQSIETAINNFCTDNDEIIKKLNKINDNLYFRSRTESEQSANKVFEKGDLLKSCPQSNTIYTNVACGKSLNIISNCTTKTFNKGDNIKQNKYRLSFEQSNKLPLKSQCEDTLELDKTWSIKCQFSSSVSSSEENKYGCELLNSVNTVVIMPATKVYQDDTHSENKILLSNSSNLINRKIKEKTCLPFTKYLCIKEHQTSSQKKEKKYEFIKTRHESDPALVTKKGLSVHKDKDIFDLRLTKSTPTLNKKRCKTEKAFHKFVRTVIHSLFFNKTLPRHKISFKRRQKIDDTIHSNQNNNVLSSYTIYNDEAIFVSENNINYTNPIMDNNTIIKSFEAFKTHSNSLEESMLTCMSTRTSSVHSSDTIAFPEWRLNNVINKNDTCQLVRLLEQKYNHKKMLQHSAKLTFQVLNIVFKFPTRFRSKELKIQLCLLKELVNSLNTHSSAIDVKCNNDVVACVDKCRSLNILMSSSSVWQIKLQNRYMLQKIKQKLFFLQNIEQSCLNQNFEENVSVFLFVHSNFMNNL